MRQGTVRILAVGGLALFSAACWPVGAEPTSPASAVTARVGASGTLAAGLPLRRDGLASGDPVGWSVPFLLFVLGGGVGVWLIWRQSGRARPRSPARGAQSPVLRLSSQALTPQASVHAVRWQDEEFLLGCTAQQVTLLGRRPIEQVGEEAQ